MNVTEKYIKIAEKNFQKGYSCSQAVLSAFAHDLGLSSQSALKIASAFGGGIARTGGVCGAVSGSFMVLGLAEGPSDESRLHLKEQVYDQVRVFKERFESRCGSTICKKLLDCDISTEAEEKKPDSKAASTVALNSSQQQWIS